MSTVQPSKPKSAGLSPKLKQMLLDATAKQREDAARIAAKLLAIKAMSKPRPESKG